MPSGPIESLGVDPDITAFGKKTQVCGILAGRRLDEVEDHVFVARSRINSTWGGNLVDMVRFDRIPSRSWKLTGW